MSEIVQRVIKLQSVRSNYSRINRTENGKANERRAKTGKKPSQGGPACRRNGTKFTLRRAYDEDKPREPLTIIEPIMTIVNSVGQFDRTKRYVSEKPIDATIKTAEAAQETSSCSKEDASTQYEEQKLNAEAIQRICASQKMEKFIKEFGTMMEAEVNETAALEAILW